MGIYLRDHPPARSQYRSPRRAKPSGLVVIHTAESLLDTVGPDTAAENVAAFIARRTTAGSYHDLVDSDSALQLVDYADEAYQDGTGSNPYALSISFALAAADWPRLTPSQRAEFLEQGARAFARQQAWLRANGHPTTPLRRVTRAQSDARIPGFISHAERDPARRTDPGAHFPWTAFFDHCRAALAGDHLEDDMPLTDDDVKKVADVVYEKLTRPLNNIHNEAEEARKQATSGNRAAQIAARGVINVDEFAAAVVAKLPEGLTVSAADVARELISQLSKEA